MVFMSVALAALAIRQCSMDSTEEAVRDLERRMRVLEERPVLRVTVDEDGNAEVDDGTGKQHDRDDASDR